jgi:hypothetical protein
MPDNVISFDEQMERRGGNRCPGCKGTKVVPIMYGLPSPKILEDEHDDYVLGGCCVSPESPSWYCKGCDRQF